MIFCEKNLSQPRLKTALIGLLFLGMFLPNVPEGFLWHPWFGTHWFGMAFAQTPKNENAAGLPIQGKDSEQAEREEADRRLLIEKFKNIDPAMAIYLDSEGRIAGTGDPESFVGEAERAGMAEHPIALEAAKLPTDRYGLVDWVEAVRMGKISPRGSLDPNVPPTEPLDLDIVIETKSRFQPRDVFSHKVHTYWLGCDNCHPRIFKQEAGGNPEMTMPKIAAGEYCGRCHNRVSFPLTDCLRCHIEPKEETTAGPAREAPAPIR